MTAFGDFIFRLEAWGVADVLLPFLLVFTIVFAVLQKTEILGSPPKKNYNTIVALVMGLAVVFPHVLGTYPPSADPVLIINNALPSVSIVLIAILMILLLIGIMGGQVKWIGTGLSGFMALIGFIIVVYIFARATGWVGFSGGLPRWLGWLDDPDTQAFLVIIIVFAILVWYITKDDENKKSNLFNEGLKGLGEMFGGKGK